MLGEAAMLFHSAAVPSWEGCCWFFSRTRHSYPGGMGMTVPAGLKSIRTLLWLLTSTPGISYKVPKASRHPAYPPLGHSWELMPHSPKRRPVCSACLAKGALYDANAAGYCRYSRTCLSEKQILYKSHTQQEALPGCLMDGSFWAMCNVMCNCCSQNFHAI